MDNQNNNQNDTQTQTNVSHETENKQAQGVDTQNKQDKQAETDTQSLLKQIDKMRKRIDSEAGKKHDAQDELARANEQIKTLTEKLKGQSNSDSEKQEKHVDPALEKALKENNDLKAQLTRRDQISQVASQFQQAGVTVPADVLNLVVPLNSDTKQVSQNMRALSTFYDSVVSSVRKSFMSAKTPRTVGSSDKPFNPADVSRIKDAEKRIQLIKEHLSDFN